MKLSNYIIDHAQLLDDEMRVNHEGCSAGEDYKERLWMKRTDDGVVCYCHNCGERLFVKMKHAHSLFANSESRPHTKSQDPLVITDFTTNISKDGLLWLFKYDISLDEIKEFKIGYSPRMNRLILPVYSEGKLVYWQGRALGADQKPKYFNPRGLQPVPFNRATTGSELGQGIFTIVEDVLSAIKVGRHQDTYAILGSKTPSSLWDKAIRTENVNVWLDKDKEQYSCNLCRNLGMYNVAVPIISDKDPKEYNDNEIKTFLGL